MLKSEFLMGLTEIAKRSEKYSRDLIEYKTMCLDSKQILPEEYERLHNSLTEEIKRLKSISEQIRSLSDITFDSNFVKNDIINNINNTCDIMIGTRKNLEDTFVLVSRLFKPIEFRF